MSVHFIYFKEGLDEQGQKVNTKMMRPVTTRDEYLKLRGSKSQQSIVKAVRSGDETLKSRLIQFNYSCLPTDDGKLKGATLMSTTVGMDIDHIPADDMQAVKERILDRRETLGLLMLELSARGKGYHIVFKRRLHLTQEQNLQWASQLLEVQFDEGAKDITRVFFSTTASPDDLIYLDDAIFQIENGKLKIENSSTCVKDEEGAGANGLPTQECANSQFSILNSQLEYKGILYSDIISKYWELFNGSQEPVEGDRNVKTFELAVTLRSICDYSLDKMLQVIPNYFGPQGKAEWQATIESALKEPRKGMPYRLRQVLHEFKGDKGLKACGGTASTPPPLPPKLPPLIKLLTKNVPAFYKPAVASAVFPALAAHLHGVKFRYWDNVDHEATFMNVLIGRQSIGKGTIKKPIEYIMEDIRQRDIPNRLREAEWKQKNPGARQKKDPRPSDICIQMIIDNLTDAVFNQRIVDANNNGERFIYTLVDEIESLKRVTSRGTTDEVGLLIRKAFDNAMAGQERVGADSVSGIAPLRWNFNACTTPPNARRFFGRMVNDGTVSRLDIATIIGDYGPRPQGAVNNAPILGLYDNSFAVELKPYIERLDAASGLIECAQAKRLSLAMSQENDDIAELYESEAYKVFSYRANVIAWLKGMVLYVAHGRRWDKTFDDFVRWSEQYNLWCKMLYFGQQLETELREEVDMQCQSGPRNLLDMLPDEFKREHYRQMRASVNRQGDGDSTLRSWMSRHYIYYDDITDTYCKTDRYKQNHSRKL